jgi:ribosomal protein L11 methyltransferase
MASAGLSRPEWMEIGIRTDPALHEALSAMFSRLECTGLVTDNFGDGVLRAYFPLPENPEEFRTRVLTSVREIVSFFPSSGAPEIRFSSIRNEDWSRNWRKFFRAERVTPFLTVVPAWESTPKNTGPMVIRIDPGQAFGTGKHPTTRLCLRAMELPAKPTSWSLLDVGTGSGILAIYGTRLGAEKVAAIDIDEAALESAGRNSRLNGLEGMIELSSTPVAQWEQDFFMVTANLMLNTILDLMGHLSRVVTRGGCLILSGLLEEQLDLVKPSLEKHGFNRERTLSQEEWACILARKPV